MTLELFKSLVKPESDETSTSKESKESQESNPLNSAFSMNWEDILSQLEQRMAASGNDWKPRTQVYLQAGDRLLDTRQLQE